MRKQKFLMRAACTSAVLAAPFLPVCTGAACCAPNTQTSKFSHLAAAPLAPATQEPTPANLAQVNPAFPTHRVRVWTNEELIATRTPADIYVFQKEAQAAAQQTEAFSNLASCFAFGQPEGNEDETQKEIDATLQSISDSEAAVAQSRKALTTAPESFKLRNQMELAQRMSELNHARERLWTLQEHLQELQKSPSQVSSSGQRLPTQPQP
jgi:hypothetical protein